ncbi:hypothetical protein MTO96_030146, partial [Rhipicephalus appendiculatus]
STESAVESSKPKQGQSQSDEAAGPPSKVLPTTASKSAGPGLEKAQQGAPAVPANEERSPESHIMRVVAVTAVLLLVTAAAGVETSTGRLVGSTVSTQDGGQVRIWQGVPYALSTAGQRRFASPVAPNDTDKCEAVLALQPRPPCAQWVNDQVLGSEDCLHLTVWAPATTSGASGKRPLVMAATGHWFQRSTNSVPQWADLAAKGDAVVVAPNVRLGVLGFLHPKKVEGITPDVAEEDMMVAMQWAMDNAAVFGADSSALMLVGNGSGAYMLVQAAGRLNVPVSRAVIEGSVYISAVPANDASMDPSTELAQKLGCDATNRTTWFSCFTGAQLDKLLSTAAQMDMRFTPVWDPLYIIFGTSEKKLPTIKEAIAGADSAQTKALIDEYVTPAGKASGYDTNTADRINFTVTYIIGRKNTLALNKVMGLVKGMTEDEVFDYLNLALSGCATRTVAQKAADKGYHYLVNGTGRPLFEPLLSTADVVKFLSDGTVPSLKDGSAWLPWSQSNATRIVKDDGSEVLDSVKVAAGCKVPDLFKT